MFSFTGTKHEQYKYLPEALAADSELYFKQHLCQKVIVELLRSFNIREKLNNGRMKCMDLGDLYNFPRKKWYKRITNNSTYVIITFACIGCSLGDAVSVLAKAYPHSAFEGIDLVESNIQTARQRYAHLPNASFRIGDTEQLAQMVDCHNKFDLLTIFQALHCHPNPEMLLKGCLC